jgi:hypothetical protein
MSANLITLAKNPPLDAVEDFYRLRREGIGLVEKTGSARWTDYNVHDPGITILEALCYAITDLGYRINWNIADILSPQTPSTDPLQPYPNQAFFTARNILTVNPTTSDDYRRVLIDLPGVHDAFVICKTCACEASYFAWCDVNEVLTLDYREPADVTPAPKEVWPLGLYEVLLELEDDPELGDLNDRMIAFNTAFHDSNGVHPVIMELRFPDISLLERDQWQAFLENDTAFANAGAFTLNLTRLGATKTFDVFTDPSLTTDAERDSYIQGQWRNIFYLSFTITSASLSKTIVIENAALRVFGDTSAKNATKAADWKTLFQDKSAGGFIQRYRKKAKAAAAAVASAKAALQSFRNLDEDFCVISSVGVEDVAVCADVEVQPDADIERVQAQIWFEIEQYFSPPVPFYTLQELRDAGEAVEDIFNGPALDNGFIQASDLEAAALKTVLRVSDIINRLMNIDGVIAINQLRLTKYDSEGNVVTGAADPSWVNHQPVFDPTKTSAAWLLFISSRHQPRLYLNQSRFLFYKNALPFLPRMDEATDTLNQLRGDANRPKNPNADKDLRIPKGAFRSPDDYFPVQHSFPLAYGIGPAGLPPNVTAARKAQAKDLKAYLTVFEQLIGNALAQLAHTADLFSLDPAVSHTYFAKAFNQTVISGFNDIVQSAMSAAAVEALIETTPEFYQRRNQFLDHLLARFGEEFREYALLLTSAEGDAVAQPRLIENKIAFLERYPTISHDRARAFNYTIVPCSPDNWPGLKQRISLLLGYPDLTFIWTVGNASGGKYPVHFSLIDRNGKHWLDGSLTVTAGSAAAAQQIAYRTLIERMIQADSRAVAAAGGKFQVMLQDLSAVEIGRDPHLFDAKEDAEAVREAWRDELCAWSANDRLIVVEHLLLRPKFIGDALYPACCDAGCSTCGNEDPYSFRLTFVMPGWTAQYTDNLDLRRFAERTIQKETPSHLLGKTCWVGNDGFVENPCDEVIGQLADLLISDGLTTGGKPPTADDACACANAIYHAFSSVFAAWYEDKKFAFLKETALNTLIAGQFQLKPAVTDVTCTTVLDPTLWKKVRDLMTTYFVGIALNGWQFERFEWAWCKWLDANAAIDWTEERLVERVETILQANLLTPSVPKAALCQCARKIVTDFGMDFHVWMTGNLAAGATFETLSVFKPQPITLCAGMSFQANTAQDITALLNERYGAYREASYWLWVVVTLLSGLRNTYPGATLHDCDDGSDQNPVRLNNTALGNYPRHTPAT